MDIEMAFVCSQQPARNYKSIGEQAEGVKEDGAAKIYDLSRPSMTADGTLPTG